MEAWWVFGGTFAFVFLFSALETVFSVRPLARERGRRLGFHFCLALLNAAGFQLLGDEFGWFQRMGEWNGQASLIWTFLGLDLAAYLTHRLNHAVPFLFRFHRVHHMDDAVDSSTAFREHFGQRVLTLPLEAAAIFFVQPTVETYLTYKLVAAFSSAFHHANLRLPGKGENWLCGLFVTPGFHLRHHYREGRSGNFGAVFSFWDFALGTRVEGRVATLGLSGNRHSPLSLRGVLFSPFSKLCLLAFFLCGATWGGSCSTAVPLLAEPEGYFWRNYGWSFLIAGALFGLWIFSRRNSDPQ